MIDSIASSAGLHVSPQRLSTKTSSANLKLNLDDVPKSKVKLEAPHTIPGRGLKIDIKV